MHTALKVEVDTVKWITDPDSLDGQENFENVRSPRRKCRNLEISPPSPELQFKANHLSDTPFSFRSFCMFPKLPIPRAAITRFNIIVGALFAFDRPGYRLDSTLSRSDLSLSVG